MTKSKPTTAKPMPRRRSTRVRHYTTFTNSLPEPTFSPRRQFTRWAAVQLAIEVATGPHADIMTGALSTRKGAIAAVKHRFTVLKAAGCCSDDSVVRNVARMQVREMQKALNLCDNELSATTEPQHLVWF